MKKLIFLSACFGLFAQEAASDAARDSVEMGEPCDSVIQESVGEILVDGFTLGGDMDSVNASTQH